MRVGNREIRTDSGYDDAGSDDARTELRQADSEE